MSFIFLFGLKAFSQTDDLVNNCNSNSIDELYSLIYSPLEPFEPPASAIDDDGNITASEDELFSLRRRHIYDQLKTDYDLIGFHDNSENLIDAYKKAFSLFESEFEI